MNQKIPHKGRGAVVSPGNRFEKAHYVPDPEEHHESPSPDTEFIPDRTRNIITRNDSPDVGFERSINPYRGCEHGCVYCFARPTHEYLGYSPGIDFETKILVKYEAPRLLREELSSPRWKPQVVAMSGVTDPYQPIERRLQLTRGCLEVLAEFRNPVCIITKNALVSRDADHLGELARHGAASVNLSITTLDRDLARIMEPRTSVPNLRLEAIRKLADAGIPAGIMIAPVIPGINDHEIPAIMQAAAAAGATSAGYVVLRLPWAVKEMVEAWLEQHFPDRKEKVLARIRDMRDGALYRTDWGERQTGTGAWADQIATLFRVSARRYGLDGARVPLSTSAFRRAAHGQKSLF